MSGQPFTHNSPFGGRPALLTNSHTMTLMRETKCTAATLGTFAFARGTVSDSGGFTSPEPLNRSDNSSRTGGIKVPPSDEAIVALKMAKMAFALATTALGLATAIAAICSTHF